MVRVHLDHRKPRPKTYGVGRLDTSRFDTNQSRFDLHLKSIRYKLKLFPCERSLDEIFK